MTFSIGVLVLLAAIALALPIGFALGVAGVVSLTMLVPFGTIGGLLTTVAHDTFASYVMLTIPMFILMSEVLSAGGVAQDMLLSCSKAMRRIKGGLAVACVLAGAVMASASGSSTATAASITRSVFPVMKKVGYAPSFALGTIAVSGTLAMMIPPSVAFVLYGLMTENSIGRLFVAGIVPGLLTVIGYIVTIAIVLNVKPSLGPKPDKESAFEFEAGKGKVWPLGVLIISIIAALYSGIATPTEIAAIGAFGAIFVCVVMKRLSRPGFTTAVGNTLRTSAMIITIIFSAHMFGYFISFTQITSALLAWISESGISPMMVIILLIAVYLVLGMIMDQAAIIILTAPITAPLVVGLGFDPIWWGVIMVKTAEIGMVTPPMGLNIFVASAAGKTDPKVGFVGVLPFIVIELFILAALVAFPQVVLWL